MALARQAGAVEVDDLATRFGVSPQTIRRDLAGLSDAQALARTHGGAMLPSGVANAGYEVRAAVAGAEKAAIGRACAKAVPDDSSLFITIGTTTEAVARALIDHGNLMVVTNNLNVADVLGRRSDAEVIVAGGVLRRADNGLIGEATAEFVAQFRVDVAVIGVSAVDEDGTLLDYDWREVRVAQAVIANARRVFLVADAGKFTRSAPVRLARLSDVTALFTDAAPPAPIQALCREHGVAVHVAPP